MKMIKKILCISTFLAAVLLTGCGSEPGTPPEVLLDGTSVVVGESTPASLSDAGFETDDLGAMIYELPERSWVSSIFLKKDGKTYTSLSLVNDTKESKFLGSCVIEELSVYALDDTNADLNISINGVNPIGMTQEELKAAYPDLEMDDNEGDYLFHYLKDGDYSVRFQYSLGVLTDIVVAHDFDKSYETK